MQARTILFTGIDEVAVDLADVPNPAEGEALVEAAYTCVSPGTELRSLAGRQEGFAGWPFIPGYALAGRVAAVGPGVDLSKGLPVLCTGTTRASRPLHWGGHISHAVLPAGNLFPLPEGVDLLEASLGILAAVAYHGVRLSRPLPDETVAVVGLGPVGQLSARLHALTGAAVVGLDLSPERVAACREGGVEATVPSGSLAAALRGVHPEGADVVVDATGAPSALPLALSIARERPRDGAESTGARYLVQGSYPDAFSVPYDEAFRRELSILVPRSYQPRDVRAVLDLLRQGRLRMRDLITQVRPPEEAPEVYRALREGRGDLLTAAFRWNA